MNKGAAYWGALAVAAGVSGSATPAVANEPLPPAAQRTVSWYAAHDEFRAKMRHACQDDQSKATTSDCQNSFYADMEVVTRPKAGDGRQIGTSHDPWHPKSPSTTAYWREAPASELNYEIATCNRMTPEHAAAINCAPARAVAAEIAGAAAASR